MTLNDAEKYSETEEIHKLAEKPQVDISIETEGTPHITIGKRVYPPSSGLRNIRLVKQWTRSELAGKLGYSLRTIESWENGRKVPRNALVTLSYML